MNDYFETFNFTTGASGAIVQWNISVYASGETALLDTYSETSLGRNDFIYNYLEPGYDGQVPNSPGIWTSSADTIPEPASLAIGAVALAGLAMARRRRSPPTAKPQVGSSPSTP